jgi:FAD/FMN-containing dehydrogenase
MVSPVTSRVAEFLVPNFKHRIQGAVYQPFDAEYDAARLAWNLNVEQHPAIIVVAKTAYDVVEAVRYALEMKMPIAVQSTGHGIVRPADNAMLIITSEMNGVTINADVQTAYVEAGALWRQVLEPAQDAGLAPLLGSSPAVGVTGYTLGGGMGWLARKYGLATDSVRYFEVVTAEGDVLRASPTENSDLFWGLRGGGGSLAIVVGMEIQLYPVTTVYGGNLFYPAAVAKEVFHHYREWIKDAPDDLTSSVAIMNFPPIPDVPEFLRGQSFVIVRGLFSGAIETGERMIQDWLDWMPPIMNTFHPMPFREVATVSNDPEDPSRGVSSGAWLRELTDEAIDTLVDYGVSVNGSSLAVITEVRHAGGAIARVDANSAAYSHRNAAHILQIVGLTPTPDSRPNVEQYLQAFKSALAPALTGGVYMNFLEGEESRKRVRQGFSEANYQRLGELKAKYDPTNVFSHAFQIAPAKVEQGQ